MMAMVRFLASAAAVTGPIHVPSRKARHGSWYFSLNAHDPGGGQVRRVRRGGLPFADRSGTSVGRGAPARAGVVSVQVDAGTWVTTGMRSVAVRGPA